MTEGPSMPSLRAALVQMRCEKGAIAANLAATDAALDAAAQVGCAVACFPEGSITGYIDPRLYPDAVVPLDGPAVAAFVALTRGRDITALGGIIEARQEPSSRPFITQVVARDGEISAVYRKRTIPDDELELFAPSTGTTTFDIAGVRCGLAICADVHCAAVFADCAHAGAKVVFECAAPGLYGAQETRNWRTGYAWWRGECREYLAQYARAYHVAIAVATQAGRTRDEDFPGGGYLFGADGACLSEAADWRESLLVVDIPLA
jgi:predicted amidohydrolase